MKKKLLTLIIASAMLLSLIAGCAEAPQSETPVSEEPTEEVTANESAEPEAEGAQEPEAPAQAEKVEIQYPLTGDDLSLSLWTTFPGNLTMYFSTFAEQSAFIEAQSRTNVEIDFREVSMQTASENFSVLIASGDYPDMISGLSSMYAGGATAAYEDEVIVRLNDYLDTSAPDYAALLDEDRTKLVSEDDGSIFGITGFYLYDTTARTNGVFIRNDWLNDLSLDAPVTYDDWYEVLQAFKTNYNVEAPLMLPAGSQSSGGTYVGGYGTAGYEVGGRRAGGHFYLSDGQVTSSLIEDAYRDYLGLVNQWYSEGLIYSDFYSLPSGGDTSVQDELILSGQVGIFDGKVDYITKYETADTTGEMDLLGIANPLKNEGDVFGFGNYVDAGGSVAITTDCEDVELALNWLNYFFTEKGIELANYGTEGVSYEYNADGQPEFTDLILNNEDGIAFGNVTRIYLLDQVVPTVNDQTRELLAYNEKELAAINNWSANLDKTYTLPTLTLTADETSESSTLLTDIETYASETIIKFIIGDEDLENWDSFVSTVKDLGIERCIEIRQAAYERWLSK